MAKADIMNSLRGEAKFLNRRFIPLEKF